MRRVFFLGGVTVAMFATACGNPPTKEMGQAQGAIDAARAAGADTYAPTELAASVDSLKRAQIAADERDFRLALNNALESRERAQAAAKESAEHKATLKTDVGRTLTEIAGLLAEADTRVAAARRASVPPRLLRQPQDAMAAAKAALQKAGEAASIGDYAAATPLLAGERQRVESALADLDRAVAAQSSRRRR